MILPILLLRCEMSIPMILLNVPQEIFLLRSQKIKKLFLIAKNKFYNLENLQFELDFEKLKIRKTLKISKVFKVENFKIESPLKPKL